jgi:hypothetical protein
VVVIIKPNSHWLLAKCFVKVSSVINASASFLILAACLVLPPHADAQSRQAVSSPLVTHAAAIARLRHGALPLQRILGVFTDKPGSSADNACGRWSNPEPGLFLNLGLRSTTDCAAAQGVKSKPLAGLSAGRIEPSLWASQPTAAKPFDPSGATETAPADPLARHAWIAGSAHRANDLALQDILSGNSPRISGVGLGVESLNGQQGFAVGAYAPIGDGNTLVNLGVSVDTKSTVGLAAKLGWLF